MRVFVIPSSKSIHTKALRNSGRLCAQPNFGAALLYPNQAVIYRASHNQAACCFSYHPDDRGLHGLTH